MRTSRYRELWQATFNCHQNEEKYSHNRSLANKPDAANPAMTRWYPVEDQWRRAADLAR